MEIAIRHVDDLTAADGAVDVAVVIDVVRAFTVAPWCLARGAGRLLLASSVESAVAAQHMHPGALLLKDGGADPRFALPNAPGAIARADLRDRTVVQRTGNGTRGAHAVRDVALVLCAGFVTASATARAVRGASPSRVLLVPTEGDEDVALAEHLTALLGARPDDPAPDATPFLARAAASDAARECRERGPDPTWPGFDADDLDRCLKLDRFGRTVRAEPAGDLLAASWYPV